VNRSGRNANGKPWRRRYIVCLNEAEAKKDAAERAAILAALDEALRRGDKSLVASAASSSARAALSSRALSPYRLSMRLAARQMSISGITGNRLHAVEGLRAE
jgi:hypothetical protein